MKTISLKSQIFYWMRVILVGVILGFGLQFAQAWVGPTQLPPNGNVGLKKYVSDCAGFAVNGWANKEECLQDGRWHKVLSHGPGGARANADLLMAYSLGADVRVSAPSFHTYWTCQNFAMVGGYAICMPSTHYSGYTDDASLRGSDTVSGKNIGASVLKSNGIITCVNLSSPWLGSNSVRLNGSACGPSVQATMEWFVKY